MTTEKETCLRCGVELDDENYNPNLPLAKRIYCNKCIDELNRKFEK